jgi:hypothetical protein
VVAEAAGQAALVSRDAGRTALAQRYYIQAFNLHMHAGKPRLGGSQASKRGPARAADRHGFDA